MKTLRLMLTATLLLTLPATASETWQVVDLCRDLSLIARDVMSERQDRQVMSDVLPDTADRVEEWVRKYKLPFDTDEIKELAAIITMEAFESSLFPPGSNWNIDRADAISSFENGYFEACFEEWSED